jgi:hypothetical protein
MTWKALLYSVMHFADAMTFPLSHYWNLQYWIYDFEVGLYRGKYKSNFCDVNILFVITIVVVSSYAFMLFLGLFYNPEDFSWKFWYIDFCFCLLQEAVPVSHSKHMKEEPEPTPGPSSQGDFTHSVLCYCAVQLINHLHTTVLQWINSCTLAHHYFMSSDVCWYT